MIDIIPTIIAKDFSEVADKIRRAEPFFNWVQLDIMDGRFVNNQTWQNPTDLHNLKTTLSLEVHLMIERPWQKISDWLAAGIKRIIIHWEALSVRAIHELPLQKVIDQVKKQQKKIGLAINPETPVDILRPWLNQLDLVLIMTVHPGQGGQKFIPQSISRIQKLRQIWPQGIISVDGGIKPDSARQCAAAGVDILSVGSYLWSAPDLQIAIKELRL